MAPSSSASSSISPVSKDLFGVSYIISRGVDGNEGDAQNESVSVCIKGDGCAVKSGFSIFSTVPRGEFLGITF